MGKMFAITAIMQLMLMSKDIKAFDKKIISVVTIIQQSIQRHSYATS